MADPITSKRVLAIQDLETRLGKIQKTKGYSSDAGLNIFLGEVPVLGKDDADAAIGILLLNDEPLEGGAFTVGGLCRYRVPIEVYATAKIPSRAQPLIVFEGLIADIKLAAEIEGRDTGTNAARERYLGLISGSPAKPVTLPKGFERGSTRIHFREGGSEIIGVTVEYFMSIEEQWGQP